MKKLIKFIGFIILFNGVSLANTILTKENCTELALDVGRDTFSVTKKINNALFSTDILKNKEAQQTVDNVDITLFEKMNNYCLNRNMLSYEEFVETFRKTCSPDCSWHASNLKKSQEIQNKIAHICSSMCENMENKLAMLVKGLAIGKKVGKQTNDCTGNVDTSNRYFFKPNVSQDKIINNNSTGSNTVPK